MEANLSNWHKVQLWNLLNVPKFIEFKSEDNLGELQLSDKLSTFGVSTHKMDERECRHK
jgi:hypothetical protein